MRAGLCLVLILLAGCGRETALVPETLIEGDAVPLSLTGAPGNAARGEMVFTDREGGHCVLCHQVEALDAPFQGNLGPDLSQVGSRLNPGQLRLRIVDYQRVKPETVMPSYYRKHDLHQVEEVRRGQPVLTAQEVEDLVAYLATLGGANE